MRAELKDCVDSNPNALLSKRPCVVTRQTSRALFLWHKHIEEKGEIINGPMLVAKCERFEELFNVPFEE
jgi:hypothetical protein